MWTKDEIAKRIDHTLLKTDVQSDAIITLCEQAVEYGFASVCVNPCFVSLAKTLLTGSSVKVCTVVGFPLGAMATDAKAFEAKCAIEEGAEEIDMVLPVGLLKDGNLDYVANDIRQVVLAVNRRGIVKVILETGFLTQDEIRIACKLAAGAGADFVKTSTGFFTRGASVQDIRLMKENCGGLRVKAAGGIRTYADACAMLDAGADRIGASASLAILEQAPEA